MTSIWAVARHTMSEAIRMRVAIVFIILLCGLVFGLPFIAGGDNTVSGRVQAFMTYSYSAVTFFLAILALFLSRSVSDELVNKQIFTLMTKPLARWQYLLGKWLGISCFLFVLLVIATAGIYGMTRYIAATVPPRDDLDAEKLRTQILTARHHVAFSIPRDQFERDVNNLFEQRLREGLVQKPETKEEEKEIKDRYMIGREIWFHNIPPYSANEYEFENILCDRNSDQPIQLRYKAKAVGGTFEDVLRTEWYIGDPIAIGRDQMKVIQRHDANDRIHTFDVPASVVSPDGSLKIVIQNGIPGFDLPRQVIAFEGNDGIEVLFKVGSFEGNMIRLMLLSFCRISFLAALGILVTAVFSFPVAMLVAITVYVLASMRGFIGEAVDWISGDGAGILGIVQKLISLLMEGLNFIIPNFAQYDALSLFVDGRNVTLKWVLMSVGYLGILQTLVVLMIAMLLFHRREVAEVSL